MWALIEDFPQWAKIGTIVVGLLIIISLNIKLGKLTKIVPWILGLIYVTVALAAWIYRYPKQKGGPGYTEAGCEIRTQTQPLLAKPMPDQASTNN